MPELPVFARPPEAGQLEPFAGVLETVLLPAALRLDCFNRQAEPEQRQLEELSRAIQAALTDRLGHALHPAVWVHALKVCCHFYKQPNKRAVKPEARAREMNALDSAYSLVRCLELHHELYALYLVLS